jgi:hypothetical protein
MARTGRPKVLPDAGVVKTRVAEATDEAIRLLVQMTATNEASVLRGLIHAGLEPYALISPQIAAVLTTDKKEN